MRRPPIACHRARPSLHNTSLDHVCISDDLLAATVSRFLRTTCPLQRRHGSHVPGPLEARRRAPKRRMTLQANMEAPGAVLPSWLDFGALFGSRQTGEPRWTYEPPSLKREHRSNFSFDFASSVPPSTPSPTALGSAFYPFEISSDRLPLTVYTSNKAEEEALNLEQNHSDSGELGNRPGESDSSIATTENQIFGFLAKEESTVERTEPFEIDVYACFEKFRQLIEATTPDVHEQPDLFLICSYLTCCPPSSDAGRFSYLVFQCLRDARWPKKTILGLFCQPTVRLPHIYDLDGLRFLHTMEVDYMATSNVPSRNVHLVYKRLAEQVQDRPSSTSTAHDDDTTLRLLIRGLWGSARWEGKKLAEPVEKLLRRTSSRLSEPRLARLLRKIWKVLSLDPLRAPLRLGSLAVACVKDESLISVGLDLLQFMPASLLRTWTASVPATFQLKELHPSSQPGQESLLHLLMWHKLLHRLDMRNNAGTHIQSSLCQYIFRNSAKTYFHSRCPPTSLVVPLMYGLFGHISFAGESSLRLVDFIESFTPILMEQHQREASLNGTLTRLIFELEKRSLPNHGVLELMIPYINKYKSFLSVSDLLDRVARSRSNISRLIFFEKYKQEVLEEVQKDTHSTRLGHKLSAFHKLLDMQRTLGVDVSLQRTLAEDSQTRRFFQHILSRANDAHIVPLAYRNLTPDLPKEIQTDLIHQYAHQYAMDRTRSCQQNWRSIRYLYFYLKLHNLPIKALFTQTVVSVCITRPLAENQFVPYRKAVWVCRLVARVESEEVARQVEQHFWAWRGDLTLRAKRELVRLGVYDMARVSTMERLKLLARDPRMRCDWEVEDDTQEEPDV